MDRTLQLQQRRAELTDRLADLDRELAGLLAAAEDSNADDEHDPEGATLAFERMQLVAVRDRVRADLTDVLAALEGPDEVHCRACGGPIGAERLAARPAADLCVSCAGRRSRPGRSTSSE